MAIALVRAVSGKSRAKLHLWSFYQASALRVEFLIQLSSSSPHLQNILFYYDSEQSSKPSGVLFLEGCYCERLVSAPSGLGTPGGTNGHGHKQSKEEKLQVCRHSLNYAPLPVKLNRQDDFWPSRVLFRRWIVAPPPPC